MFGGATRENRGAIWVERQNEKSVGSGKGVCVENAGVHYGESVCGSCVLRCVPSCACSVCRVGQDTTPPSERERATCRRMREGRRRTRCVPQRSCGVSHHVCVVCVLYMVFGRVRGAGAFLHERRSLVAVCARVVGGRLSLSKEVSRLPRLPRVNAHAVSGRKRASSSRRRASTSLMSLSTQGAGRVLVKSWPRSANETRR